MKLLEETSATPDYDQVNHVAHRMLPMFRQLKAMDSVPTLEIMETARENMLEAEHLTELYVKLKEDVGHLIDEIEERELATNQDYSG